MKREGLSVLTCVNPWPRAIFSQLLPPVLEHGQDGRGTSPPPAFRLLPTAYCSPDGLDDGAGRVARHNGDAEHLPAGGLNFLVADDLIEGVMPALYQNV